MSNICYLLRRLARKEAEWVQTGGIAAHLNGVTDASTLFMLSADTTADAPEVLERVKAEEFKPAGQKQGGDNYYQYLQTTFAASSPTDPGKIFSH